MPIINSEETRQAYQQIWRAENNEYLKDYMKWYRERNKPNKRIRRPFVASDANHHRPPREPKPAKPARIKMTHIEKARRKIERNLEKIEAKRQEWRTKYGSIINNENTTIDTQGQETNGRVR
jgi:hypothetical protein